VRSGGWMYAYYPTRWGSYWVGYSVQVQLVDTKTGRQVSNVACNSSTHENPNSPSREQLVANEAKLLKDVTASLGWVCVQILAKEQFRLAPNQVASTPAEYTNPLATLSPAPGVEAGKETASASDKPVDTSPANAVSAIAPATQVVVADTSSGAAQAPAANAAEQAAEASPAPVPASAPGQDKQE